MTIPHDARELTEGPEPPRNVRVVLGDVVIPVDLVYAGYDPDSGCNRWRAVVAPSIMDQLMQGGVRVQLQCDLMPAMTTLEIAYG